MLSSWAVVAADHRTFDGGNHGRRPVAADKLLGSGGGHMAGAFAAHSETRFT